MTNLYLDSPLYKAVFELIQDLERSVIEQHGKQESGAIKAYIFGGCAVHLHTQSRGSNDLDAEFIAARHLELSSLIIDLDPKYFNDPVYGESSLEIDPQFNTALASVTPDYKENSIPLHTGDSIIHIYLPLAVDIAVSKLSRCAEDDVKDIIALYRKGSFSVNEFKQSSGLAIKYSATEDSLQNNANFVITKLEQLVS